MIADYAEPGSFAEKAIKDLLDMGFEFKKNIQRTKKFILLSWKSPTLNSYYNMNILVKIDQNWDNPTITPGLKVRNGSLVFSRYKRYELVTEIKPVNRVVIDVADNRNRTTITEKNLEKIKAEIHWHQNFTQIDRNSDESLLRYALKAELDKGGNYVVSDLECFQNFNNRQGFSYLQDPSLISKIKVSKRIESQSSWGLFLPAKDGVLYMPQNISPNLLTIYPFGFSKECMVNLDSVKDRLAGVRTLNLQQCMTDIAKITDNYCPLLRVLKLTILKDLDFSLTPNQTPVEKLWIRSFGIIEVTPDTLSKMNLGNIRAEKLTVVTNNTDEKEWTQAARDGKILYEKFPQAPEVYFKTEKTSFGGPENNAEEFLAALISGPRDSETQKAIDDLMELF